MTDNDSSMCPERAVQEETITVVIPAYNEETTVGSVIHGVRQHVPSARVLVIDDGSTDNTAGAAREAGADVISHPLNKGNGASIKTALRAIQDGVVAVIDGDGQHNPEELPSLLERLDRFDLVVGVRSFANDEGSPLRNVGNVVLRELASFLAERTIADLTSGFRAFRHCVACKFLHMYPNGYSFPSTSTLCFNSGRLQCRFCSDQGAAASCKHREQVAALPGRLPVSPVHSADHYHGQSQQDILPGRAGNGHHRNHFDDPKSDPLRPILRRCGALPRGRNEHYLFRPHPRPVCGPPSPRARMMFFRRAHGDASLAVAED